MRTLKQKASRKACKVIALASATAIISIAFTLYGYAMYQYGSVQFITTSGKVEMGLTERVKTLKLANEGVILNLIKCESIWNEYAVHYNIKDKSYDRGILQINGKWHPEVSDECAFSAECSANWADKQITNGKLHEWTCSGKI